MKVMNINGNLYNLDMLVGIRKEVDFTGNFVQLTFSFVTNDITSYSDHTDCKECTVIKAICDVETKITIADQFLNMVTTKIVSGANVIRVSELLDTATKMVIKE